MNIKINKAENGYITEVELIGRTETRIHDDLRSAIQSIGEDCLMHFEGKARTFTGDSYGEIKVSLVYLTQQKEQ